MNKQRGKRNRRKKKKKLRVACNRTTTPLRRAITSALRRRKERRGKKKKKYKSPALTLLHQQDGHSDQHSPVQRVLHVCCCILAQTFIVVVGGENTACDSAKILKSASSPFFFFFNSALLLTGWLAGWPTGGYSIHQRCAQPKSLLQPWGRQSRRCARQAGGTEGDITSGLPAVCFRAAAGSSPHLFWRGELPAVSRFHHGELEAAVSGGDPWRCCCPQFVTELLLMKMKWNKKIHFI